MNPQKRNLNLKIPGPGAQEQNLLRGVVYMIISGLGFAIMNYFVRMAGDLPTAQKSFFRNLLVFFVALVMLRLRKEPLGLRDKPKSTLFLRSFFGLIGLLCNFYAVDHLPISDASTLNKLSPFFAILFSFFLLKEHVKPFQIVAIAIAFLGAALVARPTFANPDLTAYGVAVLGGLFAGIAYTFVRKLTQSGVSQHFVIFFFAGFSTFLLLPWFVLDYVPMSGTQLFYLILAGLFAAVGQYGVTFAYSFAPARSTSIYGYSQVLFSAVISMVFLNEMPGTINIVGYLVIFTASLILFLYHRRGK